MTTSASYRAEIDGLRAIAIASVVAYHVGVPGISGGFAGVDVFFVISGFLITGLLLKEQSERGSIDLLGFYARRARRLLPAFFVVLLASTGAAFLVLLPLPDEMGEFARSARFAALYASNLHFAQSGGDYFDAPAELMPLLHTWSLAVEEQFYIGWPLLLILAFALTGRTRRNRTVLVTGMLVAIGIVSFLFNLSGAGHEGRAGQSAFYMLHSRAWELGVGAGLALAVPFLASRSGWLGDLLCAGGLLGVAAAFGMLDKSVAYPGTAALLPVLSTAAIIAGASMAPQGILARGLGARPMVAIGLLSYGWYLWHWPLLAYARLAWLGEHDLGRDASFAVLALGLAWLTYVAVESPIRQRRIWATWSTQRTLGVSAVSAVFLIAASGALDYYSYSVLKDVSHPMASIAAATEEAMPKRRRCNNGGSLDALRMLEECSTPAPSGKRILLWGDSHADHVANMVVATASALGLGMRVRVRGGCLPLPGLALPVETRKQVSCGAFNDLVLREAEQLREQGLVGVVIAARWTALRNKSFIRLPDATGSRNTSANEPAVLNPLTALEANLRHTVDRLVASGLKVVLLGPGPEQRYSVPACLGRRSAVVCSVTRDGQLARRADIVRILAAVADGNTSVRIADPFDQLCDGWTCPALMDGIVLFRDDDHLSARGAMRLAPWFSPFLAWLAHTDVKAPETGTSHSVSSTVAR